MDGAIAALVVSGLQKVFPAQWRRHALRVMRNVPWGMRKEGTTAPEGAGPELVGHHWRERFESSTEPCVAGLAIHVPAVAQASGPISASSSTVRGSTRTAGTHPTSAASSNAAGSTTRCGRGSGSKRSGSTKSGCARSSTASPNASGWSRNDSRTSGCSSATIRVPGCGSSSSTASDRVSSTSSSRDGCASAHRNAIRGWEPCRPRAAPRTGRSRSPACGW
jgi:hypothetical protein